MEVIIMKITEKTFLKTDTRNVEINPWYYTRDELINLVNSGICFCFVNGVITHEISLDVLDTFEVSIRISLCKISEIKVAIDEYRELNTIAIVDGKKYFVKF